MKFCYLSLFLVFTILFGFVYSQDPIISCPTFPKHVPKNINDVAPSNIDVVAALGDSITAGFGLEGIEGGLDEFRGQSFAIGGNEGALTLYNIIKHYNPNVFGGSLSYHFAELPGWEYYKDDVLNAAQSNAESGDLHYQIDHLLRVLYSNNIDLQNTYKLITVLIGADDVCGSCSGSTHQNGTLIVDSFKVNIMNAFQQIKASFPNTIVNVLPMFNTSSVYTIGEKFAYCRDLHDVIPIECPCAWTHDASVRTWADVTLQQIDDVMLEVMDQFKDDDGFAIAYQPFTRNLDVPNETYVSTLDCFHPSLKAHRALATSVWNSMIVPPANKPQHWNVSASIQCATQETIIYTGF